MSEERCVIKTFEPNNSSQTLEYLKSLTGIVDSFCQPLKSVGIQFFTYSRLYEGGKGIFLCNNDQWYETKFQNDLFDQNGFVTVRNLYRNDFTKSIFTGAPSKEIKLLEFLYNLDFWNSIDLYKYEEEYKEVFHFASNRENVQIMNFYVNNISFLENFAYYFREKISKKILEAPKDIYIRIRKNANPIIIEDAKELCINSELSSSHKFTLHLNGKWISFSQRQIQCLSLLYRGKTAKEIGLILNLSYRTIESYLDTLRLKLECHTRKQIIDLLFEHEAERALLMEISGIELYHSRNFR
ncbi:MAG: hypothetical protein BGO67_10345 [Alphaproteobacteria bacterium 41-28]|nr:MAG: hypothetical protein BGO67_10345 [Alphaproteobacteria bacterium 41-28]